MYIYIYIYTYIHILYMHLRVSNSHRETKNYYEKIYIRKLLIYSNF